jgi:hypothetical protein
MCMGIPEGRGKMDGSHMGRVMSDYFSDSDRGPDRNIYFNFQNILLGITKS